MQNPDDDEAASSRLDAACAVLIAVYMVSSVTPDDEDGSIDADLARRIVATRENVGQFSSVADTAFALDLDPDTTAGSSASRSRSTPEPR